MKRIVVMAFAGLILLAGCLAGKKIQEPEFLGVTNISVGEFGMKQTRLTADLSFFNPNKYDMELKRAELEYFIDSKKAGFTVLDTLIRIPANDSFRINVNLNLDMRTVFQSALDILSKDKFLLAMTGKVRVGRNGFFFNVPVTYTGEQNVPWKNQSNQNKPAVRQM